MPDKVSRFNGWFRLEALTIFLFSLTGYAAIKPHYSWWIFVLAFLVPDISIAAYIWGSRVGAVFYNAVHSYIGPAAVLALGYLLSSDPFLRATGSIWLAHNSLDRALGYGLKYPESFLQTHLGPIGQKNR